MEYDEDAEQGLLLNGERGDDEHGTCLDCGARRLTGEELAQVELPYCIQVCPNGDKPGTEDLGPPDCKRVIALCRDAGDAAMLGQMLIAMQRGEETECWLGFALGSLDAELDLGRLTASEHAALSQAVRTVSHHLQVARDAHASVRKNKKGMH